MKVWTNMDGTVGISDPEQNQSVTLTCQGAKTAATKLFEAGSANVVFQLWYLGLTRSISPADCLALAAVVFAHACEAALLMCEPPRCVTADAPDVVV